MSKTTSARPVALVTGASRGIGRAIATQLAGQYDLILVARDHERLENVAATCRELGAQVRTLILDVADGPGTAAALEGLHVDVLVNNAGVAVLKPFLELTAEEWHRQVDVNVNALYHVTRAVLPGMVQRGRGHVCIIGSTAGRNTFVGGTCYTGTKHFVMGFAESLMLEVRDAGVGVSVITPGSVATDLFPDGTNLTWMLEPQNVADAVAFAVNAPPHMLVHRLEVRPLSPKRRRDSF
jgi:NADP-dependent 3-hydroxy acid dehydrogenase YdfG